MGIIKVEMLTDAKARFPNIREGFAKPRLERFRSIDRKRRDAALAVMQTADGFGIDLINSNDLSRHCEISELLPSPSDEQIGDARVGSVTTTPPESHSRVNIKAAEEACRGALGLSRLPKSQRVSQLRTLIASFETNSKSLIAVHHSPTLLYEPGVSYSELDLIDAVRHIETQNDRTQCWEKLVDLFSVHVKPNLSAVEEKQLASLFFNSAYVRFSGNESRLKPLANSITIGPSSSKNLHFVFDQLSDVEDCKQRFEVSCKLAEAINFAKPENRTSALLAFALWISHTGFHAEDRRTLLTYVHALASASHDEFLKKVFSNLAHCKVFQDDTLANHVP